MKHWPRDGIHNHPVQEAASKEQEKAFFISRLRFFIGHCFGSYFVVLRVISWIVLLVRQN
ncbi:MAG: hypothetical protein ABR568_02775 [Pyrinomonadaceae bacterium]